MIFGIGIDIVAVSRIARWVVKSNEGSGILARFFPESEISDTLKLGAERALGLAARFAAKEAFGKALGTGLKGIRLKDIAVKKTRAGQPELVLSGTAQQATERLGIQKAFVSLSHEKDFAVAVVILEK